MDSSSTNQPRTLTEWAQAIERDEAALAGYKQGTREAMAQLNLANTKAEKSGKDMWEAAAHNGELEQALKQSVTATHFKNADYDDYGKMCALKGMVKSTEDTITWCMRLFNDDQSDVARFQALLDKLRRLWKDGKEGGAAPLAEVYQELMNQFDAHNKEAEDLGLNDSAFRLGEPLEPKKKVKNNGG